MFLIAFRQLLKKLANKRYRDAYVAAQNKHGIAYQIRTLREQRGLSQAELGKRAEKPANVISRLENPDYGGHVNTQTLYELAAAFDVAVLIRFVRFEEFLTVTSDRTPAAFAVPAFAEEISAAQARMAQDEHASVVKGGALSAAEPPKSQSIEDELPRRLLYQLYQRPSGQVARRSVDIPGLSGSQRVPERGTAHESISVQQ